MNEEPVQCRRERMNGIFSWGGSTEHIHLPNVTLAICFWTEQKGVRMTWLLIRAPQKTAATGLASLRTPRWASAGALLWAPSGRP